MSGFKILVIDDEPDIGGLFSKILTGEGYEVFISYNGTDGISKIKKENPDLVFLDLKLPKIDGIEVLRRIRRFDKELLVIVLTGFETVESAVEAMKLGAYDYLSKPVNIEKIKDSLKKALVTREFTRDVNWLKNAPKREKTDSLIGTSPQIKVVHELVNKAAPHDITILLRGASGTGKELIAQAIHRKSSRSDKPFIAIDCATLPDTLVESEIFGYEKGAFTGAVDTKIGKFELAQGGTLFLDEIGNLTPPIQVKLLRALQERRIERLGGKKPKKVDVRLIAATNVDLEKAIKTGHFREDLYYRLNVYSIFIPLLRDREGDILLLANYFLNRFNRIFTHNVKKMSPRAEKLIVGYSWPGNVRELRNVIESAVLLAESVIQPKHLPMKIQETIEEPVILTSSLRETSKLARQKAEKELISRVLRETNWNKSKASRLLKVDYKTLYNKIKEYNI